MKFDPMVGLYIAVFAVVAFVHVVIMMIPWNPNRTAVTINDFVDNIVEYCEQTNQAVERDVCLLDASAMLLDSAVLLGSVTYVGGGWVRNDILENEE